MQKAHTIGKRGDMAFLFFPGVVWFDPVMRPLLSLIRVPKRACEQEPVLLGRESFTDGQIEWGLRLRIHCLTYKPETTERVPSPVWTSVSLSNEGLD